MSASSGPMNNTSGLILEFDMYNSNKSWIGKPSINLVTNPLNLTAASWINYSCVKNLTPLITAPDGTNTVYGLSGNATLNYHTSYELYSYIAGKTYTQSIYLKKGSVGSSVLLQFHPASFGTWMGNTFNLINGTCSGTGSAIKNIGNDWFRCSMTATATISASSNTIYLYPSNIQYTGSNITNPPEIYIWHPQLEENDIATPFVNGTRSNTQGLLDLTKNNILTLSDVTYDSNGEFSFNGTSNVITIPNNTIFNTQTPTVEVWIKTNALSQNGFFFEKGAVNTQYSLFQEANSIVWRQNISGIVSLYVTTSSYITTANYCQIVGTYETGNRRLYINGNLVASDNQSGTISTNAGGCTIGSYNSNGYYYNGKIARVAVYNRCLTAEEVKNNFNALRFRFGI